MCLSATALGLACVMSGHGDVECLCAFRELRAKVDAVTFGTHMALGTATGKNAINLSCY
jgi:hypothetical protein